jgi:hypothetical protein
MGLGGEDVWLDLAGKMANSAQPGEAALQAILMRAFPVPVEVRTPMKPVTGATVMNAITPAFGCATGGMPFENAREQVLRPVAAPLAFGCLRVGRALRAQWIGQAGAAIVLGRLRVLPAGRCDVAEGDRIQVVPFMPCAIKPGLEVDCD